jgi:hypothetical protein
MNCHNYRPGRKYVLRDFEQATFCSHLGSFLHLLKLSTLLRTVTDTPPLDYDIRIASTVFAIISILHFYKRSKDVLKPRGTLKQLVCFKIIVFLNFIQTVSPSSPFPASSL